MSIVASNNAEETSCSPTLVTKTGPRVFGGPSLRCSKTVGNTDVVYTPVTSVPHMGVQATQVGHTSVLPDVQGLLTPHQAIRRPRGPVTETGRIRGVVGDV